MFPGIRSVPLAEGRRRGVGAIKHHAQIPGQEIGQVV